MIQGLLLALIQITLNAAKEYKLTKLRKRVILYKQWYKQLRQNPNYAWYNCIAWAIYNSGTHELDGSYRKL